MIVLLIQVAWVFKFLNSPVMPGGKLYIYIHAHIHTSNTLITPWRRRMSLLVHLFLINTCLS